MLRKPRRFSRLAPRMAQAVFQPHGRPPPTRRTSHMNGLIVAAIAGGLLMDYHWAKFGQIAASACAWLLCFGLFLRSDQRLRPALAACLVFATAGEIFLSLIWGLYQYRLANIPLFVPPGHVLLFFLGMQLAARMPRGSEWAIALAAAPLVGALAWAGHDTLGPLLYGFFLVCLLISPSRRLYATMFALSLLMELYGTWIGNWVWAKEVPWLPRPTPCPPPPAGGLFLLPPPPALGA